MGGLVKMINIGSGKINLKDIKHLENSRLREKEDVSDLMGDIEQRGLLQPIGIRKSDNALIFGNRRVKAFEKLGYSVISCEFYEDLTDEEIIIANLSENLKRKNIGGIEVGRMCKILIEKGMSRTEIAKKLDIPPHRVISSISAYNVVVGTPFEKIIIFGNRGAQKKGISETLVWKMQNSLTRARHLTKDDWNILLSYAEAGKLTLEHVTILRQILLSDKKIGMNKALDILGKCKVLHSWLHLDEVELNNAMKKEKFVNELEFFRNIVRKYNPNLFI